MSEVIRISFHHRSSTTALPLHISLPSILFVFLPLCQFSLRPPLQFIVRFNLFSNKLNINKYNQNMNRANNLCFLRGFPRTRNIHFPSLPLAGVCAVSYPDVKLGLRPLWWWYHIPAMGQGSVSSTCPPSLSLLS